MPAPKLSIIMPVYNEKATLPEILQRVVDVPVDKEILIVDDGSIDGTCDFLTHLSDKAVTVIHHEKNRGKGSAVRTALPLVRGEFLIIQDGDLECDPMDFINLIHAVENSDGVVYGSRNLNGKSKRGYGRYWLGGVLLTYLANVLYGLHLTDALTCYKLIRSDIMKSIELHCTGFEFCPEITAKLGKRGIRIKEVPINYSPRTFQEGKKIRCTDGLKAAWTLLKYRFIN